MVGDCASLRGGLGRLARLDLPTLRAAWWTLRAVRRARSDTRRRPVHSIRLPPAPRLPARSSRGVGAVLGVGSYTCLEQATVRQSWLLAQGHPRDLIIGVRPGARGYEAHAWLEGDSPGTDLERPFVELLRKSALSTELPVGRLPSTTQ